MNSLIWFRNDLRINDNKAFYYAYKDNSKNKLFAIFIATPNQWNHHNMSPFQAEFIYKNLLKLQKSLINYGINLIYYQCPNFYESIQYIKICCKKLNIKKIFYNLQYEINEVNRDFKLKQELSENIKIYNFHDCTIIPPGNILNIKNNMYKKFYFFKKKFFSELKNYDTKSLIIKKKTNNKQNFFKKNINYFLYPKRELSKKFLYGEKNAIFLLNNFFKNKIKNYINVRDFPYINGTSNLSYYINIGVLSIRQCFNKIKYININISKKKNKSIISWIDSLIWREFYYHLIYSYPFLCMKKPLNSWTENINWNNQYKYFICWKRGRTGYPIIDASMRQLKKTGWINNRLRMICANFLVKNLFIDWKIGEKYFMSKLIDGNLALNNGGWQWISSAGTDFQFFRIFNPIKQSKKIDKNGKFIYKWVTELKNIPLKYIHYPHEYIKNNKLKIYVKPIVCYSKSFKENLKKYKQFKSIFFKKVL